MRHLPLPGAPRRWLAESTIFRVSCREADSWDVIQEPVEQPLASFRRKEEALSYALQIARSRSNWKVFLSRQHCPSDDPSSSDPGGDDEVAVASGFNVPEVLAH